MPKPEIKGQQLRIRKLDPSQFVEFRTKDPGTKGRLQLIMGRKRGTDTWYAQAIRLNLSDYKSFQEVRDTILYLYGNREITGNQARESIAKARMWWEMHKS